MGVSGQIQGPATWPSGKGMIRTEEEAGGPVSIVLENRKTRAPTRIRILDRLARSQ
jgi:hypothetical protein